ncbi:MAG: SRPBCC family protein [Myxococcota bacterium]|nr:SRPBCC family protein [Myxococcota bacterium]
MPEVEYTTTAKLPVETIWEFVREMDNWATFVAGYESHEKASEDDSTWVLKGDVGVLARTVKFAVHVDEWAGPERVRFSLKGLNEPMEGSGTFLLSVHEEEGASPEPGAPRDGFFTRLFTAIARFFYGLVHGRAERAESADAGPGSGMSRLVFRLRVDPGGPMAPMVNAMMKPMMMPAAEGLANQIMATLEKRHGVE